MQLLIGAGFLVLTIVSYAFIPSRKFWIGAVVWMAFLAIWSFSGMAARFDIFPINLAPVIIIPLVTITIITIRATDVIKNIPLKTLTNLQVFRVFVEVLIWAAFTENLLPIEMTFEGTNWDVLSGLTAPVAAMFLIRSKWGLAIWNFLCLALLVNVVSTAIMLKPPAVAIFPFILLPGMLVPLAYGLSFLSLRKIFSLNLGDEETLAIPSDRSSVRSN